MYTFAAGTTAAYPSTTPGLGDTMYAGSGDDTIIAGSADDTIAAPPQDTIVYGSGTVNMLAAAPSLNVSAGANQTVDEGTTVTLTGSFLDPSGDTRTSTTGTSWPSSGQQIADGTGTTFTFTPGNAGTYTVTFTVIDLNVGWDSADVVITSLDVPPVLTAPTRLAERLRGREQRRSISERSPSRALVRSPTRSTGATARPRPSRRRAPGRSPWLTRMRRRGPTRSARPSPNTTVARRPPASAST